MILLLKLIFAHVAGDFLLQTDRWVAEKERKQHRSPKLYTHALLHGALAWLLSWTPQFWLHATVITVSHFFIDLTKIRYQTPARRVQWFIIDQILHVLVIAAVWYSWEKPELSTLPVRWESVMIVTTAIVILLNPSSVLIKLVISQWTPNTLQTVSASLPDAGKFIGYLERLLVLLFILFNHWEAVGFLLAAKSVFRFGNLKDSHDRKLTEYVLIGTLLSFGTALIVSVLASALIMYAGR